MGYEKYENLYSYNKVSIPNNSVDFEIQLINETEAHKISSMQVEVTNPVRIKLNSVDNDSIELPIFSYLRISNLQDDSALKIKKMYVTTFLGSSELKIATVKTLY